MDQKLWAEKGILTVSGHFESFDPRGLTRFSKNPRMSLSNLTGVTKFMHNFRKIQQTVAERNANRRTCLKIIVPSDKSGD